MGLFDRAKRAATGGQDWAAQAAAAQELASQHLRDAGYTDGSPVTMANAGSIGADMYADREVLTAYGNELNRVISIGHSGTGIIRSAVDTGERISGNPWFQLEVEVTPAGGAPYVVSKREMVAPQFMANYAVGSTHDVEIDPADAQNIAFTS